MSSSYPMKVSYHHRKTGIVNERTFFLSAGQERTFESVLRSSFQIPEDEGVLLYCQENLFYPISMMNLNDLFQNHPNRSKDGIISCELQSFSLEAAALHQNRQIFADDVDSKFLYSTFLFNLFLLLSSLFFLSQIKTLLQQGILLLSDLKRRL
jgi:hypothetical protein